MAKRTKKAKAKAKVEKAPEAPTAEEVMGRAEGRAEQQRRESQRAVGVSVRRLGGRLVR